MSTPTTTTPGMPIPAPKPEPAPAAPAPVVETKVEPAPAAPAPVVETKVEPSPRRAAAPEIEEDELPHAPRTRRTPPPPADIDDEPTFQKRSVWPFVFIAIALVVLGLVGWELLRERPEVSDPSDIAARETPEVVTVGSDGNAVLAADPHARRLAAEGKVSALGAHMRIDRQDQRIGALEARPAGAANGPTIVSSSACSYNSFEECIVDQASRQRRNGLSVSAMPDADLRELAAGVCRELFCSPATAAR